MELVQTGWVLEPVAVWVHVAGAWDTAAVSVVTVVHTVAVAQE